MTGQTSRLNCWAVSTISNSPPDAGNAEPSPLGSHHLDVLFIVFDCATDRVETLHADAGNSV